MNKMLQYKTQKIPYVIGATHMTINQSDTSESIAGTYFKSK